MSRPLLIINSAGTHRVKIMKLLYEICVIIVYIYRMNNEKEMTGVTNAKKPQGVCGFFVISPVSSRVIKRGGGLC